MAGDGTRTTARVAALLARARRRGTGPGRLLTGGTVLAVAAPLALAAALGSGHPRHLLDQTSGTAWVVSPAQGLATLLDGASEVVVAGVRVPGAGHALGVAQSRLGAYLVDDDAGTVARLDGAAYAVTAPVALGTPGGRLTVLQNDPGPGGTHVVHVLDVEARTVTRVDPRTLAVQDEVPLTAQPAPGQAVVDDAGDLWALDAAAGTLTRVTSGEDGRTVRRTGAATATARLVVVRGSPVLVDPAHGAVHAVDRGARPGPARCLDTRPADDVQVLGSATRDEVYVAVAQTRALLVASTTTDGCARTVDLSGPGDPPVYGALAQSGRYVFVPDRTSGTAVVVDTDDGTVLDRVALADAGHRLELHAQDGFVFFNDLDGAGAGVLTLRGGRWEPRALQKYDPATGEGAQVVVPSVPPQEDPGTPPQDDAQDEAQDEAPDEAGTDPQDGPAAQDPPDDRDAAPSRTDDTDPADPADPHAGPTTGAGTGGRTPPRAVPTTSARPTPTASATATASPTPTPSATPSPSPSPSPTAAPDPTVALSTDPPSTGQPETQPYGEMTIVPTVTGVSPAATWTWQVTSTSSDPPSFTEPAPGAPLVLDSVGDQGDVTVTLTVDDDGRRASAQLVVWVKYVCHMTINGTSDGSQHVVDLRGGPTGSFTVAAHECRGQQTASLTLPPWLTGPSTVTMPGDGTERTVDVRLSGAPPGDGPQAGTVVTFTGAGPHGSYPVAVLTDRPLSVTSSSFCSRQVGVTPPGATAPALVWRTTIVVVVRDVTVGGTGVHTVGATDGWDIPLVTTSGADRTYRLEVDARRDAVDVMVTDGFGKTSGLFSPPQAPGCG